jgi:hypothetical protein
MSTRYLNVQIDGVNNTLYPYMLRSTGKGGASGTTMIEVADVFVPSAANFPSTKVGTPTRYFIDLPYDAYRTTTNSSDFEVYNETQSRALSIVEATATLTNYTCKFFPVTSERRNLLEVHVGSTSNEASDQISYKGLFGGYSFGSSDFDNFYTSTLNVTDIPTTVTFASDVQFSTRISITENVYLGGDAILHTGGTTTADVLNGGIELATTIATIFSTEGRSPFLIKSTDLLAMPFSTSAINASIYTYFAIKPTQSFNGGASLYGMCGGGETVGLELVGCGSTASTLVSGVVKITGYTDNGAGVLGPLDSDDNILSVYNATTKLVDFRGDGDAEIEGSWYINNGCFVTGGLQSSGDLLVYGKGETRDKFTSTNGVQTRYRDGVSNPPTYAQLVSRFGLSTDAGPGFLGTLQDASSNMYFVITDGSSNWFYSSGFNISTAT